MTVLNNLLWIAIYSGVVYAAIMLFRIIFKKHLSPLLMYMVWIILIARLMIPITLDPGFSLIPKYAAPVYQAAVLAPQSENDRAGNAVSSQTPPSGTDAYTNYVPAAAEQQTGQAAKIPLLKNQTEFTFDTSRFLLFAWLAGTAIMITWLFIVSLRLHNRIKLLSYPPSPQLAKLAEKMQTDMRIKQNIKVAVLRDITSPALSAGLWPVVLIPEKIAQQCGEQLAFALRHELMHLKRRDHLICLLLYCLRAVYWFNPVVWLAAKQIKLDMETLCDSLVVKKMDAEGKKNYAHTILSLFAEKEAKRFALGMALGGIRKLAERRIKGIYMRSRSGRKAKAAVVLLAAVLLVTCFTTACQPAQAATLDAQTTVTAESQYKETKKLNDIVTVKYDADVVQPAAVPQATLMVRDFTDADLQKVVDYFFAGRQVYAPWELTKTQLQNEINSLQQKNKDLQTKKDAFIAQHAWAAELYQAYYSGHFEDNDQTAEIKTKYNLSAQDEAAFMDACDDAGTIEYLIKMDTEALATAKDTAEKQPADVQFRFGATLSYGSIEIGGKTVNYNGTGDTCTVWAENTDNTISQISGSLQFGKQFGWIIYNRQFRPMAERKPLTIPLDQAQKLAEQAVAAISPELTLAESSIRTNNYAFYFTRKVAGVPISYDSYGDYAYAYEKSSDLKVNFYEIIEVSVDDGGVSRLEWRSPYTDIQVTNQNAKVISMDAAKQKFEANILAILINGKYADVNGGAEKMDSITLDIGKVQLGLTRIQDDEGNFTLVPTWDFYGKATAIKDGQEQIFYRFGQSQDNDSLGTINALDGSEIKRSGMIQQW